MDSNRIPQLDTGSTAYENSQDTQLDTSQNLYQDQVTIRCEKHTVPLAILRALDHCGYHVGQIVLTARLLVGNNNWQTLTIPRGGSQQFNERLWKRASP